MKNLSALWLAAAWAVVGVWSASVLAQPVAAQVHSLMPVVVEADRIRIGVESVPRFPTAPARLVVPAGATHVLAADTTWDVIEVSGTLRCDPTRDTIVRVTHFFTLPGGKVECGTEAVPFTKRLDIVLRDEPIDTSVDPFQWGNGWLNFGTKDLYGAPKLAWTTLADSIAATQQTVTLSEDPAGWQVGDELLFPDTDIPGAGGPRREGPITVASLGPNRRVTLSRPLTFDHFAIFDPDGNIVSLPLVANMNLARNITIRSENPNGTRGHVADVGHGATWHEGYVGFSGLGRTRDETLDNTTQNQGAIVHIGTNQVGRYTNHKHHAEGFGSWSRGIAMVGSRPIGGKWGIALHGTHDALVEGSIGIDFPGTAFVTEDGYEARNVFRKNFAAYNIGKIFDDANIALRNVENRNAPGIEGNGFWFRGIMQTIEGNVSVNNTVGMNLFNVAQVKGLYPSVPGGVLDTPLNGRTAVPVLMKNNRLLANAQNGLEYWGTPRFPTDDTATAYNAGHNFHAPISDPAQLLWFRRLLAVGKEGRGTCTATNAAYTASLEIEDSRLVGCSIGIMQGGSIGTVRLTNVEFQNVINIDMGSLFPDDGMEHKNVLHRPLLGFPKQYIVFGKGQAAWQPGTPLPEVGLSSWISHRGSRFTVTGWQRVAGQDFRLYETNQQLDTAACWPSSGANQQTWNAPAAGLTMRQCWDQFGMAYGGDLYRAADAVPLDGLVNGRAVRGLTTALGVPRLIVTYPSDRIPAPVEFDSGTPIINFSGVVTGAAVVGDRDVSSVSVDGGPRFVVTKPEGRPDIRKIVVRGPAATAEGAHTISTWRVDAAGADIPGSRMTFAYTVGPVTPPPGGGTCQDPTATNVGGPLPCQFPPPPMWQPFTPFHFKMVVPGQPTKYQLCEDAAMTKCVPIP